MNAKRIIEAVKATGAEARETVISAGFYFDGVQHGELMPIVFISIDKYTSGHYNGNAQKIAVDARKALKVFRNISVREVGHQSFYIYQVMSTKDRMKADALNEESKKFLDAFWKEIHRQRVNNEPDDNAKALEAGRTAVVKMYEGKATA